MLVLGFAVVWFGYDVFSWGYCLLQGWDITFREWSSPLHPYQWPKNGKEPPRIPKGKLWPSGTGPVTQGTLETAQQKALEGDVTGGTP